jgi:hypothetical protein
MQLAARRKGHLATAGWVVSAVIVHIAIAGPDALVLPHPLRSELDVFLVIAALLPGLAIGQLLGDVAEASSLRPSWLRWLELAATGVGLATLWVAMLGARELLAPAVAMMLTWTGVVERWTRPTPPLPTARARVTPRARDEKRW